MIRGRGFGIRWVTLALAAAVVAGCATSTEPSVTPSATAIPTSSASSASTATPTVAPPTPAPSPTAQASCAERTLASLTEPQRIGQLFVLGLVKNQLNATERDAIGAYHFGSMTFTTQTAIGVSRVRAITDAVQALATHPATGGVKFFIAANQEGGRIQGLSGPGFDVIPSALEQGAMTPLLLQQKAERWGRELLSAGVNLNFAPVADVVPPGTDAQNAPIGQLQREFGHDPTTVSRHVSAFVAGMQAAAVATTAKHFPGLGRVAGNTDFTGDVVDTVTTHDDPFLAPFGAAIRAGVPFVMVSLATYEAIDPDHLAVFSPAIIGGMLRKDLEFGGVVISDALGATAVASIPPATRAIDFLAAGGDMIISNQTAPAIEMAKALAARAAKDRAFRARVDEAAATVLRAKNAAGLLACS